MSKEAIETYINFEDRRWQEYVDNKADWDDAWDKSMLRLLTDPDIMRTRKQAFKATNAVINRNPNPEIRERARIHYKLAVKHSNWDSISEHLAIARRIAREEYEGRRP